MAKLFPCPVCRGDYRERINIGDGYGDYTLYECQYCTCGMMESGSQQHMRYKAMTTVGDWCALFKKDMSSEHFNVLTAVVEGLMRYMKTEDLS